MSHYCTTDEVKDLGSMPAEDIDQLEVQYPGITGRLVVAVSSMFDAKLRKRYATPFTDVPQVVKLMVAQVVCFRLWMKRGYNPSGQLDAAIAKDSTDALAWLDSAADSQTGLIELPLREDAAGLGARGGVAAGGPLGSSQASPYAWTSDQRRDGGAEDSRG